MAKQAKKPGRSVIEKRRDKQARRAAKSAEARRRELTNA
jgi:hypothetical protein